MNEAHQKYLELNEYSTIAYDNYLKTIFSQERVLAGDWSTKAAPFVIIPEFLSNNEQAVLWETINTLSFKFKDSKVSKKGTNKKIRDSKVLYRQDLKDIAAFFFPKVTNTINHSTKQLGLEPFEALKKEIQLTLHTNGHFFTVHKDVGEKTISRKITYVYYFNETPKEYSGGDLLLYDTNQKKDTYSKDYTRVITQNNMLILFPSFYYHQVTNVSQRINDFRKGRFIINGWFHG